MIFAETDRLFLRTLEKHELPRLVTLIGTWDVARWLSVLPFPYTMQHAEELYADTLTSYSDSDTQFHALALKSDNLLIGGIGLYPPRSEAHQPGEIEIGFWLAKDFWGKGLMSEAAHIVVDLGFKRPTTWAIGATTAISNHASQNILTKLGMRNLGQMPRDYAALRGDSQIIKWLMTREEYEQRKRA